MNSSSEIRRAKKRARASAAVQRDAEPNRQLASQQISDALLRSLLIQKAHRICCFVSFRSEVDTHGLIEQLLLDGKQVCVPWCDANDLRLCQIESLDQLEPGNFGVLEPPPPMRTQSSRMRQLADCQAAVIPGLAFSTDGKRLGYGRGYYDRLLNQASATWRVAIAFDCQIMATVPTTQDDIIMDALVTESGFQLGKSDELPPRLMDQNARLP